MALTKDEIEALQAERSDLLNDLQEPSEVKLARNRVFDLEVEIREAAPELWDEMWKHISNINFLISETYDGSRGEEAKQFAEEEVEALNEMIVSLVSSRSSSSDDIYAQYGPARLEYLNVMANVQDRTEKIQRRILEIEKQLPTFRERVEAERYDENAETFTMDDWNEVIRRVEYYNRGNLDNLPDNEAEPWNWSDQRWDYFYSEVNWQDTPPEGLFSDPIEDRDMQIEALTEKVRWLEIELNRENRLSGEYKEEYSEAKFQSMTKTLHEASKKKNPPQKWWHPDNQNNIELLQSMNLEGETIEVIFNRRDPHAQRELMLRWGIDLGFTTRIPFKVSHYSHLNNYYGHLRGHEQTTVLLSLKIDRQNKVQVKTALRPTYEADEYKALERKHLPGGVAYEGYKSRHILEAHSKIMAELHGKKGPRD